MQVVFEGILISLKGYRGYKSAHGILSGPPSVACTPTQGAGPLDLPFLFCPDPRKAMTNALNSLNSLFLYELRDLYSAETQLVDALPSMARAASHEDLKAAFNEHLEETRGQVDRLRQIFDQLGESPEGECCEAMEGLVQEGEEIVNQDGNAHIKDAALIAAAQRVEHYEVAGYGTARTYASELGLTPPGRHAQRREGRRQDAQQACYRRLALQRYQR